MSGTDISLIDLATTLQYQETKEARKSYQSSSIRRVMNQLQRHETHLFRELPEPQISLFQLAGLSMRLQLRLQIRYQTKFDQIQELR